MYLINNQSTTGLVLHILLNGDLAGKPGRYTLQPLLTRTALHERLSQIVDPWQGAAF